MKKIHLYAKTQIDWPFTEKLENDNNLHLSQALLNNLVNFLYIHYKNLINYNTTLNNNVHYDFYQFYCDSDNFDDYISITIYCYDNQHYHVSFCVNKNELIDSNIAKLECLRQLNPKTITHKQFIVDSFTNAFSVYK